MLSVTLTLVACGVVGLCIWQWHQTDPQLEGFLQAPSAVQRFAESTGQREADGVEKVSPLVVQAKALALLLNPPPVPEKTAEQMPVVATRQESFEPVPPVRLTGGTAHFKLRGTIYYSDQPGRSIALIAEPGVVEGQERWVKEGTSLGRFVIHEIRRSMIVYRDVETQNLASVREMAVEHGTSAPSIVRDVRPGSLKVSKATGDVEPAAPIPAGPNSIEVAGN